MEKTNANNATRHVTPGFGLMFFTVSVFYTFLMKMNNLTDAGAHTKAAGFPLYATYRVLTTYELLGLATIRQTYLF